MLQHSQAGGLRRLLVLLVLAALLMVGSTARGLASGIGLGTEDGRAGLVGRWTCDGTNSTLNSSRPFTGYVDIYWQEQKTVDLRTLVVHFVEQNAPDGSTPVDEHQYWTYDPATGMHPHHRILEDTTGGKGYTKSKGWEGDLWYWEGTFSPAGLAPLLYREYITRVSGNQYRWLGEVVYAGDVSVFHYDVLCTHSQ